MIGEIAYEKLLEPYKIGNVRTRNRIIKTAAGMCFNTDEYINDMQKYYFESLAKGGVGLLFVDSPTVDHPLSSMFPVQFRLDDDKYIKGFRELTDIIHKHGCPTFLQLYHCGAWLKEEDIGLQPVSASSISLSSDIYGPKSEHASKDVPRALTIEEIEKLVDKFAAAAVRAQKAGFDGLELNAGSNHLFASFLSRLWNRRDDIYGCDSLENRARFLLDVLRETKKRTGNDFPICALINGFEAGAGDRGMTLEEGKQLAQMLEKAGADVIHIRFYWYGLDVSVLTPEILFYPEPHIPLESFPKEADWSRRGPGANISIAAEIRKAVSIPVFAGGRMDPDLAEQVLKEGKVDFVGFCRRLFADPELPNKLAKGNLDDITPCLACLQCMEAKMEPTRCRVNAALGREKEYSIVKTKKKKTVLIVGGGPSGLEAARVSALRGHDVTLYEKENELGGLMNLLRTLKKSEFDDQTGLIDYFNNQLKKLGVKIVLGEKVTPSLVEDIKPDVVILATGGNPVSPDIPGIENQKVVSFPVGGFNPEQYLRKLGERIVIIGGAIHGCEIGEFLVREGRQVTIIDTAEDLGEGLVTEMRERLLWWFSKKGVVMMIGVQYEEITDKGLTVKNNEGKRQEIEADTIIIALPLRENNELARKLEGKCPELYTIGDCAEPRLIVDAINDGSSIAHSI